MILEVHADMQLAPADALFSLCDQHLQTYVLNYQCPITAAAFLDVVADWFEGISHQVKETPMRKEPTKARRIVSESCEKFVNRCARFIAKILEVSNTIPVVADQALLIKSSHRLRDLLEKARQDVIEPDPVAQLKPLLPTFPNHPQSQEEDLCRQGKVLGACFAQRPDDSPVLDMMIVWTRSLVLASTDTPCELEEQADWHSARRKAHWYLARVQKAPQDPNTRLSVVLSIKQFMQSFSAVGGRLQDTLEFLHIWLLVCDLLVDDDEDVRTQAAELTCRMLHQSSQQKGRVEQAWIVSPPATKGRLLDYLMRSYGRSDRFSAEIIVRMTGQLSKVGLRGRVAAPATWENIEYVLYSERIAYCCPLLSVRKSRSPSQPVFEEENHNLYLDPVREADFWTKAATSLVLPLGDERRSQHETGRRWPSALETLFVAMRFAKIMEVDGEIRKDSPLGYTSAPEVFSAIFAIMCFMKLCIRVSKDAKIHLRRPEWSYLRRHKLTNSDLLQFYRLRAREARLHELLVSKLDDSFKVEEVLGERDPDLPISSVD